MNDPFYQLGVEKDGKCVSTFDAEREKQLKEYSERVGFPQNIENALQVLFLEKDELPRNPYYNLVCYFRTVEVEFEILLEKHHFEIPNDNSLGANNGRTACIAENSSFWGAPAVVKMIDANSLANLLKLLKTTHNLPTSENFDDNDNQVKTFCVLTGRNLLFGPYFTRLNEVIFEQHFLITGEKFEKSITSLARYIAKDLFEMRLSGLVVCKGFWLAPRTIKGKTKRAKLWTLEDLNKNLKIFVTALKTAIVGKYMCYLEGQYKVTGTGKRGTTNSYNYFIKCTRYFVLHHRINSSSPYRSFVDNATRTLHEGLFFAEGDANLYSMLCKTPRSLDALEDEIIQLHTTQDYRGTMEKMLMYLIFVRDARSKKLVNLLGRSMRMIPDEIHYLHCHIDSIYQITTFILDAVTSACNVEEIQMEVEEDMDSGRRSERTPIAVLKDFVKTLEEHFEQIRFQLQRIIGMQASSALLGLDTSILQCLRMIHEHLPRDLKKIEPIVDGFNPHLKLFENLILLREMLAVASATGAREIGVALSKSFILKDPRTRNYNNLAYYLNYLIRTQEERESESTLQDKNFEILLISCEYEPEVIPKSVVNVKREINKALERRQYPPLIVTEGVKLQYIVDSRIDSTFETIFSNIFTEGLLPNPYTKIVDEFQNVAMRHDYWQTDDSEVLKSIQIPTPTGTGSPDSYLYKILPENTVSSGPSGVFGSLIALLAVDVNAVLSFQHGVQDLMGLQYDAKGDSYSMTICSALSVLNASQSCIGKRNLSFDPVHLVDFVCVECKKRKTAFDVFTNAVMQDIVRLTKESGFLVHVLAIGANANDWNSICSNMFYPASFSNDQEEMMYVIEKAIEDHQPIVIRGLQCHNRSYRLLTKQYILHYISLPLLEHQFFISKSTPWSHICIFFSENAAHHAMENIDYNPSGSSSMRIFKDYYQTKLTSSLSIGDYLSSYQYLFAIQRANLCFTNALPNITRMLTSSVFKLATIQNAITSLSTSIHIHLQYPDQAIDLSIIFDHLNTIITNLVQILDKTHCIHMPGGISSFMYTCSKFQHNVSTNNFDESSLDVLRSIDAQLLTIKITIANSIFKNEMNPQSFFLNHMHL